MTCRRSRSAEYMAPSRVSAFLALALGCLLSTVYADAPTCALSEGSASCANNTSGASLEQPEDPALLLANYYKRLHESSRPLSSWESAGFAYPDRREADFEALRVDHVECEHQVPHLNGYDLTPEQFRSEYEAKDMPVIITNLPSVHNWPAATEWTWEGLARNYPYMEVKVGADDDDNDLHMGVADFLRYARHQKDDSPLYVFDQHFVDQRDGRDMLRQYTVPSIFPEDLFAEAGEDDRPPYRWILIGPKRSGSRVHTDPLATSAWNTLLVGRKLWVLSPPGTLKKLQGEDKDRSEAIKYFVDYLPKIREDLKGKTDVYVLVQHPGETIFVPGGWAHGVLNLDDTVAVTQNFVSSLNFEKVWKSTRRERAKFGVRWLQRMLDYNPHLVYKALAMDEEDGYDLSEAQLNDDEDSDDDDEDDEDEDEDSDDEYEDSDDEDEDEDEEIVGEGQQLAGGRVVTE